MSEKDGGAGGGDDGKAGSNPLPLPRAATAAATKGPRIAIAPSTSQPPISISQRPLSGVASSQPPVSISQRPASISQRPAGSTSPSGSPTSMGRRPIVSKEAKEAKAALAYQRRPFYARIPRRVLQATFAVLLIAALIPVGIWGYHFYQRAKNPEEYAIREQLNAFRFDDNQEHFATIDAMGPPGVEIAIGLLTDRTPAEVSGGRSTTTAGELSALYLMHYASRIKLDPPPKAVENARNGLVTLTNAQWQEMQQVWKSWFANAQAKGVALPKS